MFAPAFAFSNVCSIICVKLVSEEVGWGHGGWGHGGFGFGAVKGGFGIHLQHRVINCVLQREG
jgi:hypothetical protein